MTDRHAGYIVVLKDNIRADDAEATISALRQIKGVVSVDPIVANPDIAIAQAKLRAEWGRKFWAFSKLLLGGEEER